MSEHQQEPRRRTCGTWESHLRYLKEMPGYRQRYLENQKLISAYLRRTPDAGLRSGVAIIPVVVHIIHKTAAENISDAQVQSQITVLNQDYRMLNADGAGTPAVFAGVRADARIQFQLAVRDPNCASTTGITRTSTAVASFDIFNTDTMKSAATGGADPWPADKYLNIWVCNAQSGQLGRATFPGTPANVDGLVISYQAFGTIGSLFSSYNLGRTATHEIGHYFDLHHVWGDVSDCSGTDFVADTPNAQNPNYGCPAFPHVSCSNGPNGDMFMNYMDYTDDRCMFMFTAGQVARMEAALVGTRASLLASDGLVPPPAPDVATLWSEDTPLDTGAEPDTASTVFWESDDIWIRNQNDGITNQEHQNPIYDPAGVVKNYVYVRVRNKSCGAGGSGTLKLYWAKASSALGWPTPWDGSVTAPALMGGLIGTLPTGAIAGRGSTILSFQWDPPNPANYGSFGADQSHFCLLARIETAAASPFGMTFPEGRDLLVNVRNNNKIVWKNVNIVSGGGRVAAFSIGNFGHQRIESELEVTLAPLEHLRHERVKLTLELDKRLAAELHAAASTVAVHLGKPIGPFPLAPNEHHTLLLHLVEPAKPRRRAELWAFDITQYRIVGKKRHAIGGQRIVFKLRAGKQVHIPTGQRWTHSHEEDEGAIEAYRGPQHDFPPSRGRRSFELHDDGSASYYDIAPADGEAARDGFWVQEDESNLAIDFADPDAPRIAFKIVDADSEKMLLART